MSSPRRTYREGGKEEDEASDEELQSVPLTYGLPLSDRMLIRSIMLCSFDDRPEAGEDRRKLSGSERLFLVRPSKHLLLPALFSKYVC
jgi:hypothetical protein